MRYLCEGCRIWLLSSLVSSFPIHGLLIGLKCCSHDRLRVKEPTTLEAKKGQYRKEYAEEHSHSVEVRPHEIFCICMKTESATFNCLRGIVFFLFLTPSKWSWGCSYGNCEGNSYPGVQGSALYVDHLFRQMGVGRTWLHYDDKKEGHFPWKIQCSSLLAFIKCFRFFQGISEISQVWNFAKYW